MATNGKTKVERLNESFPGSIGSEKIDRAAGTIRGVKVLGLKSKNGREYSPDATRKAQPMYEGATIFIDHSDSKSRPTKDRWGRLVNVAPDAAGELWGDIEFLKSHSLTEAILESIERFNDGGLSHVVDGRLTNQGGKRIVTEITEVFSVDFVTKPATNTNLFESVGDTIVKKSLITSLRESVAVLPIAALLANMADQKITIPETIEFDLKESEAELPIAVRALFEHMLSSGPIEQSLVNIGKLFGTKETIVETVDDKDLQAKVKTLQEQLDQYKAEQLKSQTIKECEQLLLANKREHTPERVAMLSSIDKTLRESLVKSWPEVSSRPERSPGVIHSSVGGGSVKLPETAEEFAKRVK